MESGTLAYHHLPDRPQQRGTAIETPDGIAMKPAIGKIPALVGAYALLGGIITLIGWIGGIPRLTDWIGLNISMFANTAAAAVLSGAALLLAYVPGPRAVLVRRVLGTIVLAIGAATLFEHLFSRDLGIDRLLSSSPWGSRAAVSPGRMGPPASSSFALIGCALLFGAGAPRARRAACFLGLSVLGIALLSLLGAMYEADLLYTLPRLTGIAPQTSTILLALSIGVVALSEEYGPARLLREQSAAGLLARRALPLIVLMPIVLGWIRVRLQIANLVDTGMGTAFLVLSLIFLLCALLAWSVSAVASHERALHQRAREIGELNQRLQRSMAETHHRVKNNLQVIAALVEVREMGDGVDAADELKRISHHIRSLATIHDLLTAQVKQGDASDQLSVKELLEALAPHLQALLGGRCLWFDVEQARIPSRQGTSLAVLVNELVNNSVKHGAGEIGVSLSVRNDCAVLRVYDEGPGFPEGFDPAVSHSTGLQLVESISRHDLMGSMSCRNREEGGAEIVVEFPILGEPLARDRAAAGGSRRTDAPAEAIEEQVAAVVF